MSPGWSCKLNTWLLESSDIISIHSEPDEVHHVFKCREQVISDLVVEDCTNLLSDNVLLAGFTVGADHSSKSNLEIHHPLDRP